MARVPFIGRLFLREYLALFGSLILVALEVLVRAITLGLPQPIIRFCYNTSKSLFNILSSQKSRQARSTQRSIYSSIATCSDFTELCASWGYYAEEHIVQTGDGYLLGVHRLPFRKGEEETGVRVNAGPDSIKKPVVYLHHGLLMNSEVWVCITEEERCLPFVLASQGYDVWLGNNRGNKYSKKSTRSSPTSPEFWNFSIDEFAFHDIPNTIDYVLNTTSQTSLSYIGFSQGTAQAFASLSIHPGLNDKVNLFVALAPAMAPAGLSNGIVDSLIKTSPDVLFLAFGRKSILSSATMWQSILYPPIFVRLIDMSLSSLFAWYGRNISLQQKLAAYPHLYSFTSTKSVVHWFQIIRNRSFQMYDDDSSSKFSIGARNRYYKVAKFPTRNIRTPIVLVYGGSDSLVDIRIMLKELPRHTIAAEIPHYEHLDFLWAQDVHTQVFPHVLDALRYYALGRTSNGIPQSLAISMADTAQLYERRNNSESASSTWSEEDDTGGYSDYDGVNDSPRTRRSKAKVHPRSKPKSFAQQQRESQYQHGQLVASPHTGRRRSASSPQASTSGFMNWVGQYYNFPTRGEQGPKVQAGAKLGSKSSIEHRQQQQQGEQGPGEAIPSSIYQWSPSQMPRSTQYQIGIDSPVTPTSSVSATASRSRGPVIPSSAASMTHRVGSAGGSAGAGTRTGLGIETQAPNHHRGYEAAPAAAAAEDDEDANAEAKADTRGRISPHIGTPSLSPSPVLSSHHHHQHHHRSRHQRGGTSSDKIREGLWSPSAPLQSHPRSPSPSQAGSRHSSTATAAATTPIRAGAGSPSRSPSPLPRTADHIILSGSHLRSRSRSGSVTESAGTAATGSGRSSPNPNPRTASPTTATTAASKQVRQRHSFTPKGIRVGSSKPSVGAAQPSGPQLPPTS
ncbi:putative lipase C16A3.12c [Exophiala dermatitidis]